MANAETIAGWVEQADARTSKVLHLAFPPESPVPLQKVVRAAWESFRYLQGLRGDKSHWGDQTLACAEHYAYARVVACAGGVVVFPFVVSASLTYQMAKRLFDKWNLRQQFGLLVSNGGGYVTPTSPNQLQAAIEGAEDGLALHFRWFSFV
jgi:hypothetical protein